MTNQAIPRSITRPWADRRIGTAAMLATTGGWGLLAGWWIPRGPLTTAEALSTMGIGLTVGVVAGFVLRSRWAMLAAPTVAAAVFELARLGTDGPTVDGIHASPYGIFALVVGRAFHTLIGLTPMVLGAAMGAGTARRLSTPGRASAGLYIRRGIAGLTAVVLIALAAMIARPSTTAPLLAADATPVVGSINELTTVEAGGKNLGLMLRGISTEKPVLLFLAGGPGGSERGAMRNHLPELEKSFVVATVDQRGTGTSYPELDPATSLTLAGSVADTIAVTNYLRGRFHQDRIYLMGQSGGTIPGILAVQEAPALYHAFIGTGQMVSPLETDRIFYRDTLAWAGRTGDTTLVQKLNQIGQPPYENMLDYETALSHEPQVYPYDRSANSEGVGGFSENFLVPEYTLTDQVHMLGAFMDTFAVMYPQFQDIDFRKTATRLEVPVYFAQGAHEAPGRSGPFQEWFAMLDAPSKDVTVLATSGHRPLFEQPAEFVEYMTNTVLPRTPRS
jgi:pimeloyl-ACP methyl ester carboxylesterase